MNDQEELAPSLPQVWIWLLSESHHWLDSAIVYQPQESLLVGISPLLTIELIDLCFAWKWSLWKWSVGTACKRTIQHTDTIPPPDWT
jgi:hypothetical protein